MRIIKWINFLALFFPFLCFSTTQAKQQTVSHYNNSWNVATRFGTLGFQGEIGYRFNESFHLRGQAGGIFHQRESLNFAGVTYHDVSIRPQTYNLIADWYFLNNYGFKLSIGGGYNRNKIVLHRTFTVEEDPIKATIIGTVKSKYHFSRFTPYSGIGYDSKGLFGSNFSVSIDVGAYFQGKSKANVSATGPIQYSPSDMAELKKTAENIVNDSWWLKTYPVISISLRYCF